MSKSPIKRRTQAERREGTMQKIMEASYEVMKRQGYAGFTISEVAKAARVSRGAILHHYPNKDSLILATFEYLHVQTGLLSQRHLSGLTSPAHALNELISDGMEFFFGDYFWTIAEVALSSKDPAFRQEQERITGKYRVQAENLWQEALVATGVDAGAAEKIVPLSFAIVRGFAMQRRIRNEPVRTANLLEVWHEMVWTYWPDSARTRSTSSRAGGPAPKKKPAARGAAGRKSA